MGCATRNLGRFQNDTHKVLANMDNTVQVSTFNFKHIDQIKCDHKNVAV